MSDVTKVLKRYETKIYRQKQYYIDTYQAVFIIEIWVMYIRINLHQTLYRGGLMKCATRNIHFPTGINGNYYPAMIKSCSTDHKDLTEFHCPFISSSATKSMVTMGRLEPLLSKTFS